MTWAGSLAGFGVAWVLSAAAVAYIIGRSIDTDGDAGWLNDQPTAVLSDAEVERRFARIVESVR